MPADITDVDVFTDPVQVPVDGESGNGAAFALAPQGLANRTRNNQNRIIALEADVAAIPHAIVDRRWEAGNMDDTLRVNPVGNSGWTDVLSETDLVTPAVGDRIIVSAYAEGQLGGSNSVEQFDFRLVVNDGSDNVIAKARKTVLKASSGFTYTYTSTPLCGQFAVASAVAHTVKLQFQRVVPSGWDTSQGNIGATQNCWMNSLIVRAL